MFLKPRTLVLIVAALIAACVSCASPGTTRFLSSTQPMAKGHHIDKSWSDPNLIDQGGYSVIELGAIDTSMIKDRKGITATEAAAVLGDAVGSSTPGSEVLSLRPSGRTARLELAITEVDPGDAVARVIAAELGAGHAYVQVEGRVVDAENGTALAAVADRRRGTGAIGLRDVVGSSGPAMVREMLSGIGADIRKELAVLFRAR